MKGFWIGVLASVVAGAITWAGTEAYSDWRDGRAKVVSYLVNNDEIHVGSNLANTLKNLPEGSKIASVEIKNVGREELPSPKFRIASAISPSGEDILGFGVREGVSESTEDPVIKSDGKRITVEYPVLRPGEGSVFWIAHRGFEMFDVANLDAGVAVEDASDQSEDGVWSFLLLMGIALGSFILGLIAAEALNRHVLRRIGLDPNEVAKLYAESEKKKSNG